MNTEQKLDDIPPYQLTADILFDPLSGEIRTGMQTLCQLSPLQARAFHALLDYPDRVVLYEELLPFVYGDVRIASGYDGMRAEIERLQSVVARIREKIADIDPIVVERLETFPQRGFRWRVTIDTEES